MPSSYTPRLRAELQGTGENSGSWGTKVNTLILEVLEEAIAGVATVTMLDANYTLTTANGVTDEARQAVIHLTGVLTAARNVICPTQEKLYMVYNNTTGGFSIVFKTTAGLGVTVLSGKKRLVYCDGTDVVDLLTDLPSGTTINNGAIYSAGGTDVALADGGTGTSLSDPGADRGLFWDESGNVIAFWAPGTGLAFSGTTLELDAQLVDVAGLTPTLGAVIIGSGTNFIADTTPTLINTITINKNANSTPEVPSQVTGGGETFNIFGLDGAGPDVNFVGYAAPPAFSSWRAQGTGSAPSATQLNQALLNFNAGGYGATGWGSNKAQLSFVAAENWTDSAQGTYIAFGVTPTGSTVRAVAARITSAGLLLNEGGAITWDNGDVTLTQTGDLLIVAGGELQSRVPLSTETTGTLTIISANKKVNCTGGITLDDGVFATNDFIRFDPGTANRTFTRAAGLTMYVNGVDSASATLASNQIGQADWRSASVVLLSGAFV